MLIKKEKVSPNNKSLYQFPIQNRFIKGNIMYLCNGINKVLNEIALLLRSLSKSNMYIVIRIYIFYTLARLFQVHSLMFNDISYQIKVF